MKRFVLLLIAAAVLGFGVSYIARRSRGGDGSNVFRLLPKETLAVAVLPDVSEARAEWHKTEAYKLWREPALQEVMRKPLGDRASSGEASRTMDELQTLGATDVFVAVTGMEFSAWKIIAGFRFKTNEQAAERTIERWRAKWLSGSDVRHETAEHRGHRIRIDSSGIVRIASAFAGGWFLAANGPEPLKSLLNRVDNQKDAGAALNDDETFAAAARRMPGDYAGLVYARVDALLAAFPDAANAVAQAKAVGDLRSFCGAMWFDGGRIRDRSFAQMPKRVEGELGRSALALGSSDTWLCLGGLTDIASVLFPAGGGPSGGIVQPLSAILGATGVTAQDWKAAFTDELDIFADWPAGARWPTTIATIPVKDAARAKELARRLAAAAQTAGWSYEQRNGADYFGVPTGMQMLAIAPTLAFSDRMLVGGLGPESVEAALGRIAKGGPGLAAVNNFKNVEALLPAAKQSLGYVDTALLYTRLDAALRPMLLMSAAFVPSIRDTVDLSKLPEPEVITKHLSPIMMSQSYTGDGYLTESVGPITFTQAAVAVGAAAIGAGAAYKRYGGNTLLGQPFLGTPAGIPPPAAPTTPSPNAPPRKSPP